MIKISSVIITYNEEADLPRCIECLKRVADEIIIVDSYSTDNTVAIAQQMGAKVWQKAFNGFGEQKAYAVSLASHDWILSTDVDEILDDKLIQAILAMKQQPLHNAYYLNLMNNYCGKWIKHCGWYPEYKLRLLNKHHATMNLNKVHEGFSMNTKGDKPGYLPGHLLHYSYYTIADHVQKIQLYTNWAVEKAAVKKRNISLLKLLVGPRFTFFYHFVLRLGFLDGYWGYVLCKNLAYETFVKYVKIRAFNQQNKAKP